MSRKRLAILIVCLLALPIALVACGEQKEEVVETTPVQLVVTPSIAAVGETVSILASGLSTDDEIDLRILIGGNEPFGITGLLTALPVVQESGAFVASLKLTSTNFTSGLCVVQLVVDDELVANAPLQIK